MGDEVLRAAVERALGEHMIAGGQHCEQRGRNRCHAACRDQRVLGAFERCEFGVQGLVIWRVVEADVAEVVIARLAGVLEHRRLKDRHLYRARNARLPGVDQLRVDAFECHARRSLHYGWHRIAHRSTPQKIRLRPSRVRLYCVPTSTA